MAKCTLPRKKLCNVNVKLLDDCHRQSDAKQPQFKSKQKQRLNSTNYLCVIQFKSVSDTDMIIHAKSYYELLI